MPPHILVVEDEEPLLELLRYNFEKAGYAVETIADGDARRRASRRRCPTCWCWTGCCPGSQA